MLSKHLCRLLTICLLCIGQHAYGQNTVEKDYTLNLIHEINAGKIVPNHLNYPASSIKVGYLASFLWANNDSTDVVNQYYNNPQFGFQLGFHRLGNPAIFGNQIDALPILNLPTKRGSSQIGLGLVYFTKNYFDNAENPAIINTYYSLF